MTKNRTPTPVYLDPGMHSGLEVKGLNNRYYEITDTMNKLLSIVQQVKLCLEVVWERPPYFAGRGINVKDNKSYHI